ncbi:glycerophosphodiester phosphodiesterase [Bosea minatitlanensis]|uniref:Glycerophosphodiester phosphodiesterase n=1 Tax=Bosea minatitlanensis TaxID=128782 RepID=A0ABW0F3V5_9HYPH|nr:glycerophosphodiester phosphodiesterase family protein [Bosea minatitlanensis]MCT4493760.1 glycerophosphodiester phosphodiesterase family protein [Bosea minatitlanensis]
MRTAFPDTPLPLAIAHRGGALLAAENSAAAFRAAAAAGAEMVETDLRLSADGRLVCLHDADLARIGGDRRRVADTDLATLRALLPGLLTLEEAVAASQPLGLLLDVKLPEPAILPPILAVLAAAGASRRCVLGLRETALLAAARALAPDLALLAFAADPDAVAQAREAGAGWFRLWQAEADESRIGAVRAAGMRCVVMVGQPRSVALPGYPAFPVGRVDADGLRRILALRPDAVMLDDPRLLVAARAVTGLSPS